MAKQQKPNKNEKSVVKGLAFANFGIDGNPAVLDIKDGKIIRIRPLHYDWKYTQKDFGHWQMKARGQTFEPMMKTLLAPMSLAYKNRVYSPNRILYPLKRADWDPDGERNTANRGKSGYVRISWDEAAGLIAKELKRIKKQYGPEAVLSQSDGHGEGKIIHAAHGCANKLLVLMGGYTLQMRNTDSWEGWVWGAKHVWGMDHVGEMEPASNLIPDIAKNTDLLLFWGCDPETTTQGFSGQMASRICYWYTQLGIKSVYICPDLNYGAAIHADKWIPILPNTDAALQLAIAYIWLTEDTYDKLYIATHTYGFEKFKEYVLGKEDGIPKTPAWAAPKCGIPEWTIKALARAWGAKPTSIAHGNGGAGMRSAFSTEQARLEVLLLAMQGLGKPGTHQVKMMEWSLSGFWSPKGSPMPMSTFNPMFIKPSFTITEVGFKALDKRGTGDPELDKALTPGDINPQQVIPKDMIHDAILHPPISWYGNSTFPGTVTDQFVKYTYPAKGCSEVHMIWTDTPCWITCWNDSNTYMKALQNPKIETIVAQHQWLENDCLFADIILPINTKIEEHDLTSDMESGQFCTVMGGEQCIEPIGESRSDYEAVCAVAEKLGLLDVFTGGKTVEEWVKTCYEHSGVQKKMSYEAFREKGYYVIPNDPEWEKQPVGMREFYDAPEKHPLQTPTGKIEFCSKSLTEHFPDDDERPPVPHWVEKGTGHDDRISSQRARKYPLILMSNHGRWRVHAQHDDMTWLRECPTCKVLGPDGYKYEPCWLNPADAAARGIKHGDIVQVFNERGIVLCGAYVTERLRKGVVYVDHGARYDPIVPGEIDRGGAINTITPHNLTSKNTTGMVVSSFLVEVAPADMEGLRRQYPKAFQRPYHPDAGLRFERVLEKK
jgi:anaerobic selenocysteine-containing dehydrogenase